AQLYRAVVSGNLRSWRRLLRLSRLMAGLAPCDLHLGEGDFCLTLAQGLEGKPRKARRLALRGIERAGDALRLIARAGIEQIASNLSPVMSVNGESVEGVHQMRVGVRRLRSALSLFRPLLPPESAVRVLADLRELGSLMGPVRDRDVFLETIMAPVRALASDHEGLISLEETLTQERDAIFDAARHALDQSRFASFMLDLLEWSEAGTLALDSDLLEFADAALDKRHAKLIKAGRDFETLDPLQRHALRIRGKKMRYAGDFLQSLFPSGKTRRYLDALAELVEVLGHLNDIAVAKRVLEERLASSNDSSLHHGIGLAEGWHAGRAALLEEQAVKAWAEFKRQDRFWK
ncbi:MAG: CHAD domain-containing protein, partial [Rhodospirillales bacterium]